MAKQKNIWKYYDDWKVHITNSELMESICQKFNLMNKKDRKPELLEMVTVKKETGEVISLDQFIDIISTLKIQKNA